MSLVTTESLAFTERSYGEVLFTQSELDERFKEMAPEIVSRYDGQSPLFVTLLKGGVQFASALMSKVVEYDSGFHPQVAYADVSAYGANKTAGTATMRYMPGLNYPGQRVVILDDTLEKGVTASAVTDYYLEGRNASGVDLIVMTKKPLAREQWQEPTMFGFDAPDAWLTGMGLDDPGVGHEANRWLPFVALALRQPEDAHSR